MQRDGSWASLPPFLSALMLVAGLGASALGAERAQEPAFQGHAAEMLLRTEEEEQRRRALFFDPVDVELGEPGLPCDHLAKSKPQSVAGPAYVVLLSGPGDRGVRTRVWFPPGSAASIEDASSQARAAATRTGAAEMAIIDQKKFMWCR